MALKMLNSLCRPSYLYFMLSMFVLVFMVVQNIGNTHTYCLGDYKCQVPNTLAVFIGQVLYIVFWTWVLNLICRAGYPQLSWFLVLFPFILFFVLLGLMILQSPVA